MPAERVRAKFSGAASHGHLLDLIRSSGGMSRQQLLASTGMSRATLYERLDMLMRRKLIYEAESLEATGGRRSRKIRFDDRGRVVLAFALGQTHATVAVTDISGGQLRSRTVQSRIDAPSASVLEPLIRLGTELLAEGAEESLVGVGFSLPAPVEAGTGYVVHPTTIPEWEPDAVVAAISRVWPVPLIVENDARAGALGECTGDDETIVYVKVATGLGCGVVVDGSILRGAHGAAGDIGHILVASDGPVCRCGRRGCLATFSSGTAILDRLRAGGVGTMDAVVSAAKEEDRAVQAVLRSAAQVLGGALAATVTTVNPNRLVLGGIIGTIPVFAEQVRVRVLRDVVERIADGFEVLVGAEGDRAAIDGLTRLVVRKVFAPESIDASIVDYAFN